MSSYNDDRCKYCQQILKSDNSCYITCLKCKHKFFYDKMCFKCAKTRSFEGRDTCDDCLHN